MMKTVRTKDLVLILQNISASIHDRIDYLTELDSVVGDGDHGSNLDRGFTEVSKRLGGYNENDIGALLELTGSTLLSTVGGASGPLYGTAFRKAGRLCKGKSEIGMLEISLMFEAAEKGIVELGAARVGDKTILDSMHPAIEAAKEVLQSGELDLVKAFEQITSRAESGLESTKQLVARKGRASYLGERSLGNYDVGAASFCVMLRSALETLRDLDRTRAQLEY